MTAVTGRIFPLTRLDEEREGEVAEPGLAPGRAVPRGQAGLPLPPPALLQGGPSHQPRCTGPELSLGELQCPAGPGLEPRSGGTKPGLSWGEGRASGRLPLSS